MYTRTGPTTESMEDGDACLLINASQRSSLVRFANDPSITMPAARMLCSQVRTQHISYRFELLDRIKIVKHFQYKPAQDHSANSKLTKYLSSKKTCYLGVNFFWGLTAERGKMLLEYSDRMFLTLINITFVNWKSFFVYLCHGSRSNGCSLITIIQQLT